MLICLIITRIFVWFLFVDNCLQLYFLDFGFGFAEFWLITCEIQWLLASQYVDDMVFQLTVKDNSIQRIWFLVFTSQYVKDMFTIQYVEDLGL